MEPHWKAGGYYRIPKDTRAPKVDNICIEYICPLCEVHGFEYTQDFHLAWQLEKTRTGKVYRKYPWIMRYTKISDATELGKDLEPIKPIVDTRPVPSGKKRISQATMKRELISIAESVPYPFREDPNDPELTLTAAWYGERLDKYRRSVVDPLNKLVISGVFIRRPSMYPHGPFIYEMPR